MLGSGPSFLINDQNPVYHIFSSTRELHNFVALINKVVRPFELTAGNLSVKVILERSTEREFPSQQNEKHNTERPDVGGATDMLLFHGLLGAHVVRRAAAELELTLVRIFDHSAEPKVNNLGLLGLSVNQYVVKFKVPVNYPLLMHVLHRLNNLGKYLLDFIFFANSARWQLPDVLIEVVAINVLNDDGNLGATLVDGVVKFHDADMVQPTQSADFSPERLDPEAILN